MYARSTYMGMSFVCVSRARRVKTYPNFRWRHAFCVPIVLLPLLVTTIRVARLGRRYYMTAPQRRYRHAHTEYSEVQFWELVSSLELRK